MLFSVGVLILALFVNWHIRLINSHQQIANASRIISNKIDGLVEHLCQNQSTLPATGTKFPKCEANLHKELELVITSENHNLVVQELWFNQLILSALLLFGSGLLYYLVKYVLNRRYSLHAAMKAALKNHEFFPVYQATYDATSSRFCGAEVLLRWQLNEDEILMPKFFIKEAETSGLIIPMTLNIIKISLQQTQELFTRIPDFHLAYNLSALHFKDKEFFNEFYKLIEHYKIKPKQIIFEITERDLLDKNDPAFLIRMKELRKAGYSLAIDDYGTGHASISYLHHFPFNYLKIDKQFVQAIGSKALTESLNDAIIQMAKRLHLTIIAEGVETQEQAQYLISHSVTLLQGWHYSKAETIDKLISLLHL